MNFKCSDFLNSFCIFFNLKGRGIPKNYSDEKGWAMRKNEKRDGGNAIFKLHSEWSLGFFHESLHRGA